MSIERTTEDKLRFERDMLCIRLDELRAELESVRTAGVSERALLIKQRDELAEELRQYKNLEGQGWFHPDVVADLRTQRDELLAQLKHIAELGERYAALRARVAIAAAEGRQAS